jgi:hypothetical protein
MTSNSSIKLSEVAILTLINSPLAHKYDFLRDPPKTDSRSCCGDGYHIDYEEINRRLNQLNDASELLKYLETQYFRVVYSHDKATIEVAMILEFPK